MRTRKTTKITKLQLVEELSELTTISMVQCDFMVDTFLAIVKKHLINEQDVELKTLGRFYFFSKGEKFSNMTKEPIPPQKQLKFRVANRLGRIIRMNSREY